MANVVYKLVEVKGSYARYESDGTNGACWFSKAAFVDGKVPDTLPPFDLPNLAPVKATKVTDPEALKKAAEKAEADAAKKAARATALRAKLAALVPPAPAADAPAPAPAEEPAPAPAADAPAPAAPRLVGKGKK